MTSNQIYQKDYTEFHDTYQLVLPLSLEGWVPKDESVRLLSHVLEELDYHDLYKAYSHKGRNPAVEPKLMFKIVVYAYSQGIYSSRKIEEACRRDINFYGCLQVQKRLTTVQSPVFERCCIRASAKDFSANLPSSC